MNRVPPGGKGTIHSIGRPFVSIDDDGFQNEDYSQSPFVNKPPNVRVKDCGFSHAKTLRSTIDHEPLPFPQKFISVGRKKGTEKIQLNTVIEKL